MAKEVLESQTGKTLLCRNLSMIGECKNGWTNKVGMNQD